MKPTAAEYMAHGSDLEKMLAQMGILPRERDRGAELRAEFEQEEREEADRKRRAKIAQDIADRQNFAFDREKARLRQRFPNLREGLLEAMAHHNMGLAEDG